MSTLALVGLLVVLLVAIGIAGFLLRGRRGASADPDAPPRTVAELVDRRRASAREDVPADDAGPGDRGPTGRAGDPADDTPTGVDDLGAADGPDQVTTPLAASPAATPGVAARAAELPATGREPGTPPADARPDRPADDASAPAAADTGAAAAPGADEPGRPVGVDPVDPVPEPTDAPRSAPRPGSDADTGASSPPWSRGFVGGRQITPPVAGPSVEKRSDGDGQSTRPSPPPRQEGRSPVDPDLVKRVTSVPSTGGRRSSDPDTEREFREARDRMAGPVAGRHSRVPEQSTRSPEPEATARPRPTPSRRERPAAGGAASGLTGAGIAASALSFRPSGDAGDAGDAGDDGPGTDEGARPSPFPRATDTGSGDEPPPRPAPRVMRSTGPLGAPTATGPTATGPTATGPTATEPTEPTGPTGPAGPDPTTIDPVPGATAEAVTADPASTEPPATVPAVDEPVGSETTGTSASAGVATGAVVAGAAAVASSGAPAVVDAPATDPTAADPTAADPTAADDAAGPHAVAPTSAQDADHDTGSDTTVSSAPATPATVEEEPVAFAAPSVSRTGPVPSTPAQDVEVEVGDGTHRPLAGVSLSTVDSAGAPAGETVTGADGTARLRAPGAGRYLLVASAEGFETRVTPYSVADEPVRVPVTLTRSSSLRGTVAAGATVALSQDGDEIARTAAGSDGAYRFDGIGAGHYLLTTDRGPGSTVHVPAETDVEHDLRAAEETV